LIEVTGSHLEVTGSHLKISWMRDLLLIKNNLDALFEIAHFV